ncbi:uncharacterized protein EV154DRAFT_510848 [Mucor mucedo]|uniref:uncharacterized protein n=1 Tax=Mucor mucedo TaxID=29922 RepID=UPI00221E45C2|nr:uncharacterized protein EV154DRAFT_510848 [Mucor mucedo]KAI7890568.1 hypothetical protein EV154DRAFT_510848 [Mucor mucedo]
MTLEESGPIALQFQLLFNGTAESNSGDVLYKQKTRMYPTFKVELNGTAIYRLVHHEFERHFVTAGQLFKACGLTLTEGFFLFELKLTEFEVDFLISQFPYCDIWVSVEQARVMALGLGVETPLELLLSESLDDCYSSDNISRNEIMHNWIVPSIPNLQYSTRALLETSFETVELLEPPNRKIRTQISRSNKQVGMVLKDRAESGLVRWQVWAYEQFLQQQQQQQNHSSIEDTPPILDRSGAIWDTLQGLLSDLQTLGRKGQVMSGRVLSDNMMVGNMPLKKEYLGHSLLLQQLYIAVMVEKLVNELNRVSSTFNSINATAAVAGGGGGAVEEGGLVVNSSEQAVIINKGNASNRSSSFVEDEGIGATTNTSTTTPNHLTENMLFHDRMDLLEQELYRVKRRTKKKLDEYQFYQDDLTQQINELNSWKSQSDRVRKSERVWMLMLMVCVIFGVFSLRTFYFK